MDLAALTFQDAGAFEPTLLTVVLAALAVSGVVAVTALVVRERSRRAHERVLRDKEAELRDRERRLSAVVETAVDGILTIDENGIVGSMNPAAARLFGYRPDEVIGRNIKLLMPEPFHSEHDDYLRRYLTTGERRIIGVGREVLGLRKDGTTFPMELAVSETELEDGRLFTGIVRDVSARARVEEALRDSEARLRLVTDGLPVLISYVDRDQCYQFNNRAYEAWFDTTREAIRGRHMRDVLGDAAYERIRPHVERVLDGEIAEYETEILYRGSHPRHIHALYVPDGDARGRARGFFALVTDVSHQKQAETARLRSEERLSLAAEAAQFGSYDVDLVSGHVYWSPEMRRIVGLGADAPVPVGIGEAPESVHHEDRERVAERLLASFDPQGSGQFNDEHRIVLPDGVVRWVLMRGRTLFAGEGDERRAVRATGTILDITERKETEESLRRKTAALVEEDRRKELFLATLGHELRNPIAALDSAMNVLERGIGDAAELQPIMAAHVRQLATLVDELLEMSRISRGKITLRKSTVELAHVVEAAVRSVHSSVRGKEQILTATLETDLRVHADATRLEQVAANLLSNASKYTPEHGTIEVVTRREGADAVLVVRDDGRGLDETQLESIFQPFVQGEPGGGGLGIGLTLVKSLVGLHGGSVAAESAGPGHGSTFTVRVPIGVADGSTPARRESPPRRTLPRALRVLIVDDLKDAADMLALLLRSTGAEVTCAYNGADAIETFERWRPDAALIDIGLPDMSGYDVARRVRGHSNGALLLAVTGFGDPTTEVKAREAGFDARLVKPVDHAELHERLVRHVEAS